MINQFILFASVVLLDRISKTLALSFFQGCYEINQYLSCTIVMNNGIAWGFMNDYENFHACVTLLVLLIYGLMSWYTVCKLQQKQSVIGELLVLAGGFSNIMDRFYYGAVVDFIMFHYKSWIWPVFNIADAVIVGGICIIFIQNLYYERTKIA